MPEETKPDGEKPSSESTPPHQDTYFDDPYSYEAQTHTALTTTTADQPGQVATVAAPGSSGAPPFVPTDPDSPEEDDDDDGMLRMSFLEHLEELRSRIIKSIAGLGTAFLLTVIFANELWNVVQQPIQVILKEIGGKLVILSPMDAFMIIWVKLPLLASLFIASPWVLFQVWSFIAPGLYKKERRLAVPFILSSAGLFILGGCFAYFVAFRFGLRFLLSIATNLNVEPSISVVEYFDLFVNVILGIAVVFELPILVFFLILLRIVTPTFLMANSRYAILGIVVLAAVVTPTPDVVNLMIFALPMIFLYFLGVFAGWLFVMRRDKIPFPWGKAFLYVVMPLVLTVGVTLFLLVNKFGYKFVQTWPFLSK